MKALKSYILVSVSLLMLNGCATAIFSTYSERGFYADHKGSKGNTYKGCEVWQTCGHVEGSDLYGTNHADDVYGSESGSVWGGDSGSVYGNDSGSVWGN